MTELFGFADGRAHAMFGGGAFGSGTWGGGMGGMGGMGGSGMAAPAQQAANQPGDQPSVTSVIPVIEGTTVQQPLSARGKYSDAGTQLGLRFDTENDADAIVQLAVDPKNPNAQRLSGALPTFSVVSKDGIWSELNLSGVDAGKVLAMLKAAAPEGAVLLRGLPPHETGYWNPAVVTGADGKATLTFTLPERSTGWSLLAKGMTQDTLGGEASQEFTVRKDLFGELKCAAAYTDGDKTEVVVSVHNDAVEKGEIEVALTTRLGDKSTTETKKLPVTAKGIHELSLQQTLQLPPEAARTGQPGAVVEFELIVSAGDRRDVVRRSVPVRPFGMAVYAIAGGSAAGDAAAVVQSPPGMTLSAPRLQILIGPTVERSLLDAVLAPATWCQADSRSFASDGDSTASDLIASLALQKLLGLTRDAAGAQAESLDARVRAAVSLLVSQQNDDGGWSWSAAAGCASNPYHSARTLWRSAWRVEPATA